MAEPARLWKPTVTEPDAVALAEAWMSVDPDENRRAATQELLDGDRAALDAAFGHRLQFGTAGLRGPLGPGPGSMNRVLVRVVATAIARRLLEDRDEPPVVIGFDARHESDVFAEDTARAMAALGVRCSLFDAVVPTPVLAHAVLHLGADASVMVTASHNPRHDNGYKVYWGDGAQIRPPVDSEIAALIDATPLVAEADLAPVDDPAISSIGADLVESYVDRVVDLHDGARSSAPSVRVAYTPLHGVGRSVVEATFRRAGLETPHVVESQGEPDPDFPTAAFPNPEEPGVLDPLFELATSIGADVAMANDPDADRLAIAIPVAGSWRLLTGDELGCLLAEHLLTGRGADPALVVNTIVSSRLLALIAADHGATATQTLTGFKWIMAEQAQRDEDFVLGYEEALGYTVGSAVRDKDGIGTALVVARMIGVLGADGRTLAGMLDDLHRRHGVHVTGQRSVRFEGANALAGSDALAELRWHPPPTIGDEMVTGFVDLSPGTDELPPTDAVVIELDGARLVLRPSGTEPKLKVYGEAWTEPGVADLTEARAEAYRRLERLIGDVVGRLADPERHRTVTALTSADAEVVDRAATLFGQVPAGAERAAALRLIVRCIDLTTLAGDDTPGRVRALCAQARRPSPADPTVGPTAAVCVYPALIGVVSELLAGSGVAAASVAGAFPSGLSSLATRLADIDDAVQAGADEIDIVLNRAAFLSEGRATVAHELHDIREALGDTPLKVILEIDELPSLEAVREASRMAIDGGAEWLKTSTGKTGRGATPHAVLAMCETVAAHVAAGGRPVGVKISGGVRTADEALGYLSVVRDVLGDEWLSPDRLRYGASSLLGALVDDLVVTEQTLAAAD